MADQLVTLETAAKIDVSAGPQTLHDLFWNSADAHGELTAQCWYDDGVWKERTYHEMAAAVREVANGLLEKGFKKGERVAIWSKNLPQWAEIDFADQTGGFVTVPIYDTLTGEKAAYILNNSGAKVVFVQDAEVAERLLAVRSTLKSLQQIIVIAGPAPEDDLITDYASFRARGAQYAVDHPQKLDKRRASVKPDDLASFVYTSGTTADPKGVMLTHRNFATNAWTATSMVDFGPKDCLLSFLPLAHVFERTGGHFGAYGRGAKVVFARSIDTIVDDMGIHHPTIMTSVPRLYEKMHSKIVDGVEKAGGLKKRIFKWALAQGMAANVYRQRNEELPPGLQRKINLADRLVFGKVKERVGGRLRFFVSGGAALSKEIEEFFWAVGIPILQGYGLTETSPVTHINCFEGARFGSAGKAIPGVECKIDTKEWKSSRTDVVEGEICVRGPNVMVGYYKNEKATKECLDKDGWFRTGDVGYLDAEDFLFITDRKKEIIVMSNGKNVAPQPIEGYLKLQPHIAHACLIGDDRKYISALIVPDFEKLEDFAQANGIAAMDRAVLVADQRVVSLIEKEVEAVNTRLPRYEQIKKWWILADDWSVEAGELTPTLKVKRRIVSDKFKAAIEKLYPSG